MKYLSSVFMCILFTLSTTMINAQDERFVMGDDELNVVSSSLNKKGTRSTFSKSENIYLKFVSAHAIQNYLETKKELTLCLELTFKKSEQTHYIYPHFQDDNMASSTLTFALKSEKIANKGIIDLRKEYDQACHEARFKTGELQLRLLLMQEKDIIKKCVSTRTIKIQ